MAKLGVSIYPEQSTPEKDKKYLESAASLGYSRIFTSLLQFQDKSSEEVMEEFVDLVEYASSLGFEVIADIDGNILTQLGISSDNLEYFANMGLAGVRLDNGISGPTDARMTRNPYGLKIEFNMSHGDRHIDNVISYRPKVSNMVASHNFYPQPYTGLSEELFIECNKHFNKYNITTMAFVNAPSATFGPWDIQEGLCTLEDHRYLPIETQVKHILLLGGIDDIVIANAYASERDLKAAADVFFGEYIKFKVEFNESSTDIEKNIILNNGHIYRGDTSDYMIRSSHMRVLYQDANIPVGNTEQIEPGDLLINNNAYGRYKGEFQIALRPMRNTGKVNVVGRICKEEQFLLERLPYWSAFGLVEEK